MGFLSKRIRELIKKKKRQKQAVIKKTTFKDVSFMSANSTAIELTEFVNTRINTLTAQAGSDEVTVEDFSIQYIDRTVKEDYKSTVVYESIRVDNNDWMTEKTIEESELNSNKNRDALTFYMIIIEYITVKRS